MAGNNLKKKLIRESVISGVIVALCVAGFYSVQDLESSTKGELSKVERETQQIDSSIRESKQRITDLSDAIRLYDQINQARLPSIEGLSTDSVRIRASRSVLEPLRRKYKLQSLDVTFSRTEPVVEDQRGRSNEETKYRLFKSTLDLEISASSDEVIFSVINEMVRDFQGYLHLQTLEVKKAENAWELVTIAAEEAQQTGREIEPFGIVDATATFEWITVEGTPVKTDLTEILNNQGDLVQ